MTGNGYERWESVFESLRPGRKQATAERTYLSPELEQDLRNRLNRIEGHVRGIRRMLDAQEDCEDLLIQMAAVKAALNQATIKLLEGHMDMCVAAYVSTGDSEALDRLTRALGVVLKRW